MDKKIGAFIFRSVQTEFKTIEEEATRKLSKKILHKEIKLPNGGSL